MSMEAERALESAGLIIDGGIVWDGRRQRVPTTSKPRRRNGWYYAFDDAPRSVVYGSWEDGHPKESRHVWSEEQRDDISKEDMERARKRVEAIKRKRAAWLKGYKERAARRYAALYDRAGPANPTHLYAQNKGITPSGCRQIGHRLIVPMRSLETRAVVSVQAIEENGFKRFAKGGQASNVYAGLGNPDPDGRIATCEGWATGLSILETGHVSAVVVSFTAGNLPGATKAARQWWPNAEILACHDNDLWSKTWIDGEQQENPGLVYGRKAAAAGRARLVGPVFADLEGRPTDFNDLHQREGIEAVRRQLAGDVVVGGESDDGDQTDTERVDTEQVESSGDKHPFRCLGFNEGTYYYMSTKTGQITPLTPAKHEKRHFLTLAPLAWWEYMFPGKDGPDWTVAADWLMGSCHDAGIFRPDRVRGRGCWIEDGGVVVHLGDRMMTPSGLVAPHTYGGSGVYQRQVRISGPGDNPMTQDESEKILDLFSLLRWEMPASAILAAGWTALAPVCGALPWRPHVWVTGARGSGKSAVMTSIITPLLGDMALSVQGETTEAGIRQSLKADALPVLFDEAEVGDDQRGEDRLQHILALARQASSESDAKIVKGSASASAVSFKVRSMFCLASIGANLKASADKSRFTVLSLAKPDESRGEENDKQWREVESQIAQIITPDAGARLIAKTIKELPSILKNAQKLKSAATAVLGSSRMGDQYGLLLSGAWSIYRGGEVSDSQAREFVEFWDWETYTEASRETDEEKCLNAILDQEVMVDGVQKRAAMTVGELLAVAIRGPSASTSHDWLTQGIAEDRLNRLGIRTDARAGCAVFANSSEWLTGVSRGRIWSGNWGPMLRRLPGAKSSGITRFGAAKRSRGVSVPYGAILSDE